MLSPNRRSDIFHHLELHTHRYSDYGFKSYSHEIFTSNMHRYTPGITETTILFIAQCSASIHPLNRSQCTNHQLNDVLVHYISPLKEIYCNPSRYGWSVNVYFGTTFFVTRNSQRYLIEVDDTILRLKF